MLQNSFVQEIINLVSQEIFVFGFCWQDSEKHFIQSCSEGCGFNSLFESEKFLELVNAWV